jgi:hypothetical protein
MSTFCWCAVVGRRVYICCVQIVGINVDCLWLMTLMFHNIPTLVKRRVKNLTMLHLLFNCVWILFTRNATLQWPSIGDAAYCHIREVPSERACKRRQRVDSLSTKWCRLFAGIMYANSMQDMSNLCRLFVHQIMQTIGRRFVYNIWWKILSANNVGDFPTTCRLLLSPLIICVKCKQVASKATEIVFLQVLALICTGTICYLG